MSQKYFLWFLIVFQVILTTISEMHHDKLKGQVGRRWDVEKPILSHKHDIVVLLVLVAVTADTSGIADTIVVLLIL